MVDDDTKQPLMMLNTVTYCFFHSITIVCPEQHLTVAHLENSKRTVCHRSYSRLHAKANMLIVPQALAEAHAMRPVPSVEKTSHRSPHP